MKEILESKAKINLFLDITSKCSNGYHNIESAFHIIDLKDIITIEEIEPSNNFEISTSGKFALDDNIEDNIVHKVCLYFQNNFGLKNKYKINIEKNIPVGAGLGGGSSNAASIIKFLSKKVDKNLGNDSLKKIGSIFGADVNFFIDGGFQWGSGIGDILEKINEPIAYHAILIYPNIHVQTQKAYSLLDKSMFDKGNYKKAKSIFENKDMAFDDIVNCSYNIFENSIFNEFKEIQNYYTDIEELLNKKISMSGSGSTLYILYENLEELVNDFLKIQRDYFNNISIHKVSFN